MKELEYPDLDKDIRKHETMLDEMEVFLEEVPHLKMGGFEITLASSTHRWLVRQIVTENRRWARWLKKNTQEKKDDEIYDL